MEDVRPKEIIHGFRGTWDQWDVPLVAEDGGLADWDLDEVKVPPGPGRLYLSDRLDAARRGRFDFLGLPPEIRNRIYGMLYTMASYVIVNGRGGMSLLCRPKETAPRLAYEEVEEPQKMFELLLKRTNLPFLLQNRQMHQEAMPFFFALNAFVFFSIDSAVWVFRGLRLRRCVHLTKLEPNLELSRFTSDLQPFTPAMRRLAQVKRLAQLQVVIRDWDWLEKSSIHRAKLGRRTKYKKLEQIPGCTDLAVACRKAEKLTVSGDGGGDFKKWGEDEAERERVKAAAEETCKRQTGKKPEEASPKSECAVGAEGH